MIDGIKIIPLQQIPDDRGKIMHMLRCTDPHFTKFGEIYFSCVYPGIIKGWHLHKKMTLNYCVVKGMIRLVLYDKRDKSKTSGEIQEIYLGDDNYCLVIIPPMIWNGFLCIGTEIAIVANCATEPHDPNEIERIDPYSKQISYDWKIKMR